MATTTLSFNDLLKKAGFDPKDVRLARHRPANHRSRKIYQAALHGGALFQEYQESQSDAQVIKQLRNTKHLAAFITEPGTKSTVFAGLWDVLAERPPLPPYTVFETKPREDLAHYRGRLVIDWGAGERAWVQRADLRDKAILELRPRIEEPSFPGFAQLQLTLDKVENLPFSWQQVLRNARGIYLLVHRASGQQYVGSAYGNDGVLGRWTSYLDGHGGNIAMRELAASAETFDASILEVVGSDVTNEQIFERETRWKQKLGTRVKGLNRN